MSKGDINGPQDKSKADVKGVTMYHVLQKVRRSSKSSTVETKAQTKPVSHEDNIKADFKGSCRSRENTEGEPGKTRIPVEEDEY
jgi:hypothetical protein